MMQLIYSSAATKPFSADALRTLLIRARESNTTAEVSGMLLHVDGTFLQVLEGDAVVVKLLFDRIARDPRHKKVLLLHRIETATRNFGDWSMGYFDASGRGASLPGYRQTTGFADLLGDSAAIARVVTEFRDGRWRSLAT